MKNRRRRTTGLSAAVLTLSLLLTGCGGETPPEETPLPSSPAESVFKPIETLSFALPCSPGGDFHPIRSVNRVNLTLWPLIYEGLFQLNRSFEPEALLCVGYTVSEDHLSWTFQLDPTATFSDGSPLTGADVAYSLELARQSEHYVNRLTDVTGIQGGEGEVTVLLSRPNGALPALLDIPIVKETEDPTRPLGTGVYMLTGTEKDLMLTARPGASVPLPRIPLRNGGSGDDLVYAFDAREISLVAADLTGTHALGFSARLETTDYPTTTMLYVGFNTQSGLCHEQGVRQALSVAFDREMIAGKLLAGHAVRASLPIHPSAAGYDSSLAEQLEAGPEAARTILQELNWLPGEDGKLHRGRSIMTLKLLVNQENTYKASAAESLARDLGALGITVNVEKLPWEDFQAALTRGDFDLYLGEVSMTADFDLEPLLGADGPLNYGGYRDAQLPQLLLEWRNASGLPRQAVGKQLYAHLADTAPIAPLCFKNGSLLTQWGQVKGAEPTQRNIFFHLQNWEILEF